MYRHADRWERGYPQPKAFVKAIDGYWSLDHDECEEGLKQLVAPGVEPNVRVE